MKRALLLVAVLLVGVLTVVVSCRTTGPQKIGDIPVGEARPAQTARPLSFALVLRNLEGEECKPASIERLGRALVVEPLVPEREKLPSALRAYCVVKKAQKGLRPLDSQLAFTDEDIEAVRGRVAKAYEIGFDYPVVMMAASPLEMEPALELRTTFLERAGGPKPNVVTWPQTLNPVRIAVVDSVAGAAPTWPLTTIATDRHAAPLGRMMQELLCEDGNPEAACFGQLFGYSALPTTLPNGQQVGMLNQLAGAITQAVSDADDKLVINLSLGWVPVESLGGTNIATLPPATRAVYDSLRYAACKGAVTFAAAGNNLGAPGGYLDDKAVFPARWMGKRSFGCGEFELEGEFTGTIVHAVGAVNAAGYRAGVTRDGSFPNLVAFGVRGAASKDVGVPSQWDEVTAPMSGTSVATAVASAAAAARWSLQPGLSNKDLVIQMKAAASPIAETVADFVYDSNKISRMKVCEQVDAACSAGASCAGLTYSCRVQTDAGPTEPARAAIRSAMSPVSAPALTAMSCPGAVTVHGISGSTHCPVGLPSSVDESPHAHAQPGCSPCEDCFFAYTGPGQGSFFGSIVGLCLEAEYSWLELTGATTTTLVDIGGITQSLGLSGSFAGDGVVIDGLPAPTGGASRGRLLAEIPTHPSSISNAGEVQTVPLP